MSYQFLSEKKLKLSGNRFNIHYSLFANSEQEALEKANDIIVEQTVEFPAELVPEHIKAEGVVGKIEKFNKVSNKQFDCTISYANEIAGNELTQLINVIFGNISLKPGIKVERIELHNDLASFIKGPRFGIKKTREFWNIEDRPIICSALKPMGLSANDLAHLAGEFALGGVDLIKDDHGLANQSFSSFEERVEKCQKSIYKNNPHTVYAPNISGGHLEIKKRALFAKAMGCRALLISPALVGFDTVSMLANDNEINLPIIAHPAFIGSLLTSKENGFSHYALLGQMMRMIGADVSIYPNFGGRFSFSKEECSSIVKGCSDPLLGMTSIFPSPGGGMNFTNVPEMLQFYGKDVIYLMGGGLFKKGPDLIANTRELKKLVLGHSTKQ
jgi:ribulose-bisphosphate carboxylase large chain